MSGKWLELLKQIVPRVTRVGVLRDIGHRRLANSAAIQSVAPSLGVEMIPVNMRDADGMRTTSQVLRVSDDGLIVTGSGLAVVNRNLIITLAAQHQLPAIYWDRLFVSAGGLISYGADLLDQFRQAACTSIASLRARSLPICRCRHRPSSTPS